MKHKWDEEWGFLDKVYSTCAVCGGTRVRNRVAGIDYIGSPAMWIDRAEAASSKNWRNEKGTPRSCPGVQETPDAHTR